MIISKCEHRYRSSIKVFAVCWSGAFRCVLTQCQGGKTSAMTLEKQLFLPSVWEESYCHLQTFWSPSFYSEEVCSQMEDCQNGYKSSQEWTSQQIHPNIRPCNAQKNSRQPKIFTAGSGNTSHNTRCTCYIIRRMASTLIFVCFSLVPRSPWPRDPVCVQIRGSLQSPGSSTYPDQMVDQHLERTSTALKDSGDQDN